MVSVACGAFQAEWSHAMPGGPKQALDQMAASVAPNPAGSHGDTEELATELPKPSLFSGSLTRGTYTQAHG